MLESYPITMTKKIFFFLLYSILPLCFIGLERREFPDHLNITIIIPCHPNHIPLLYPLLCAYEDQTSLPEEIVISLSECGNVSINSLSSVEKRIWPFQVKLIKAVEKHLPGKNRNIACAQASGDLIICQDADDLPHPQRVEIIRYLFEHFQIEHLMHQWLESDGTFHAIKVDGIENQCMKYRSYYQIPTPKIHNGSVAFLRSIFRDVHWRPHLSIDEDCLFNQHVYAFFPNHYVLVQPLIRYRGEFSTFDLNGNRAVSN